MREDLDALVASGLVEKYETGPSTVTLYMIELAAGAARELKFRSIPGIAGELSSGESRVFAYYSPEIGASAASVVFSVSGGK